MTHLVLANDPDTTCGAKRALLRLLPCGCGSCGAKARAAYQTNSQLLRCEGRRLNSCPVLPDRGKQVIISRYSYQHATSTRWLCERPGDASPLELPLW